MKKVRHGAKTRGHENYGWLDTFHTFSFGGYHHPERMRFGKLRVLNDDVIEPGMGFGTHPHENMEIITVPINGDLEHKDSMGNNFIINEGDVQIMSAGTGIHHSEYNKNEDKKVNFLQIWIYPKEQNIEPQYAQRAFKSENRINQLQLIVAPDSDEALWVNQDAYLWLGILKQGSELTHKLKSENNGVYLFVIEGDVEAGDEQLRKRDGLGLWELDELKIKAIGDDAEVLLIEVPMD